jgi:multiple sugar transport system ATP-binding protein
VAGFIGSPQMNFLDAVLNTDSKGFYLDTGDDRLYIPAARATDALKAYVGKPVKLGIRPEDIHDDEAFIAANPDSVINAAVDVSEMLGSEVYLYLAYGEQTLTARVASYTNSKTGDRIKAGFNMNMAHLFDAETEEMI